MHDETRNRDAAQRPDLVLVMTDQQRFDQIGYASGGHFETPTLDRLAAGGVIFDAAYSASTTCVPARVSLLTGLLPHRVPTQENGAALREGFWTVAHELRAAGYETALFGKMHFAPVHAQHGFETMRLCEHIRWQDLGPLSKERGDEVDDYHGWLLQHGLDDWRFGRDGPLPAGYPTGANSTVWIEREVSSFLATRDRSRPLFLVVSFLHPHAPYDAPEPYASMYAPADSILPPDGYEANEALPLGFQLATEQSRTRPEAADPTRVRTFLALARGMVRHIDDAVASILTKLDLDSTRLFFTSDHGDFSGHRGLMRKNPWIAFDDLARVPFFVAGGGLAGGRRIAEPVQSFDLALTCLDYAGLHAPAGADFDSRSLRPILDRDTGRGDPDRAVVCGTGRPGWPMLRRGRYKYLEQAEHSARGQRILFDLDEDPLEHVNRYEDRELHDLGQAMADELHHVMDLPVPDLPAPR